MHGSHLSRVETGRIVPSLETLQRWAWALDTELYEFFLAEGQTLPPGARTGRTMRVLELREERLLELFGRMDVRSQDLVLSMAESVDKHLPKAGGRPARKPGTTSRPSGRNGGRELAELTELTAEPLASENR